MTVGELLDRISSRELSEWMVYAQLEPFGEARADLRAGIVASTMANTVRDPKRRKKPFGPEEFMPQFDKEPQTPDEQKSHMETLAALGLAKVSSK